MSLILSDFSYTIPDDLIAKHPTDQRDTSRLFVLNRQTGTVEHKHFSDICDYFKKGEVIVLNDTRVFPCRLITQRKTGGRQEILLLHTLSTSPPALSLQRRGGVTQEWWRVLINASSKIKSGATFDFDGLRIKILSDEGNERDVLLEFEGDLMGTLAKVAHIPLPPYINRPDDSADRERYQTVYARKTGSVAAPTAGLHFTTEILDRLKEKGVQFASVTLHVGPGTFLPVRVQKITDHQMHGEYFSISQEACDVINRAKTEGRTITAVGTTTTRVLESVALQSRPLQPQSSSTNIFIYPPYEFKIVDRLITNFHLPESTLLMLVSAFAGRESVLRAYQEAVYQKYRFFSYGDAMLIG